MVGEEAGESGVADAYGSEAGGEDEREHGGSPGPYDEFVGHDGSLIVLSARGRLGA